MSRKKSGLASFEKLSPNKTTPRQGKVCRNTPHHAAGNLTAEALLGLNKFQKYDAKAGGSCSYGIGSNGKIGLGVEETNRPWTSSNGTNDHKAITFEIANNGGAPDWRISDEAINSWLDISVDIAKAYGYKQVKYQPKPANISIAQVEAWINTWSTPNDYIITLHNWFKATTCPGPYFTRQIPWLVKEMNKRLNGETPEKFIGENAVKTGSSQAPIAQNNKPSTPAPVKDQPKANTGYLIKITTPALNVRTGPGTNYPIKMTLRNDKNVYTIIEEADGKGATKWGKFKSEAGWISLDFTKKV